jgi:hypothetical protein
MEETLHRALRLFESAKEDNPYLYFELAWTRKTEWMCWLIDQTGGGRVELAKGQSDLVVEAVDPVMQKMEAMGYS